LGPRSSGLAYESLKGKTPSRQLPPREGGRKKVLGDREGARKKVGYGLTRASSFFLRVFQRTFLPRVLGLLVEGVGDLLFARRQSKREKKAWRRAFLDNRGGHRFIGERLALFRDSAADRRRMYLLEFSGKSGIASSNAAFELTGALTEGETKNGGGRGTMKKSSCCWKKNRGKKKQGGYSGKRM